MVRHNTHDSLQQSAGIGINLPPSRPRTLVAAVSMAVTAVPAMAFDNQVDVWVRPGTDRSYGGIEGVLPLGQDGTSLSFADLKFKLGQSGTYEGNVGLGYRFLTDSKDWSLGVYGAWDHRNSRNDNKFNQVTVGAEALSDNLDFRFNYYLPLTDRAFLDLGNNFNFQGFNIYQSGIWEEAMRGFDVEAGVLLPISDKFETRAYAAYYNFEGEDIAPQMDGWRVRLEVRPTNNITIGLSHQQDDMFDDQTSLEMRYTFGKDGKSGVRTLKERMTDPWTRDIDIVVSTPQEGPANREFGKAVADVDVVHIDSNRGSDVTGDGSYEHPYATTDHCETVKCGQDDVTGGVGDYNVIRLWEGNSRSDGGYQPITLLGGQMLAGEPITARNIVYTLASGLPSGAFFDPVNPDADANGSGAADAPLINGANGGNGTAVVLASNTSVLGIASVNGGIRGTNVSGDIGIMHNRLVNYYDGGFGVYISNENVDSNIRIHDNTINAGNAGIMLGNSAYGGNATMQASILRNNIAVDALYYGVGNGVGIMLYNMAVDGVANMNVTVAHNTLSVAGEGSGMLKYGIGSSGATGISAFNGAANGGKYYAGGYSSAVMNATIYGNQIGVYGTDTATGVMLGNVSLDESMTGAASATQNAWIGYNVASGEDGSAGIAVTGRYDATGIAAFNAAIGGVSGQNAYIYGNTIRVNDLYGSNSATGVALVNLAMNGNATQGANFAYNNIHAVSEYGNATGINAYNAGVAKYYAPGFDSAYATQNMTLDGDTIYAESSAGKAQALGISMQNSGVASGYYSAVQATQNLTSTYYSGDVSITANSYGGSATGIYANNDAGKYYGGSLDLQQTLDLHNASINAHVLAYGPASGDAIGVDMNNYANTGRNSAVQNAYLTNSTVEASINPALVEVLQPVYGSPGMAIGIDMSNRALNSDSVDQSLVLDNVDVTATNTADGAAIGVRAHNEGDSTYYGAVADAQQMLGFYNGVNINATSSYYTASGIEMLNDGNSNFDTASTTVTQNLTFATGSVTVHGYNDTYGILAEGVADADNGGTVLASQTVILDGGVYYGSGLGIASTSQYGSAYGVYVNNEVNAGMWGGSATSNQTLNIYDANISATSNQYNAVGVGVDNHVYADGYWDGQAEGNQTLNMYNSVVSASGNQNGGEGYVTYGIYAHNSIYTGWYSASASGESTLAISNSTIQADSDLGDAIGIHARQDSTANYGGTTATQSLDLSDSSVSASAYYTAIGLEALNNANAWGEDAATATQTVSVYYSSIGAISSLGNAFGVDAHNTAEAGYNFATATATQSISLDVSTMVSATAWSGNAYGIHAYNMASSQYYHGAVASQSVSLDDSSVLASGSSASGIQAENTVDDWYSGENGSAFQTLTASDTLVSAHSTYYLASGAAVSAINDNNAEDGIASQTVAITSASSLSATGGYNMDGLRAMNYGQYPNRDTTVQMVTLIESAVVAEDWGVVLVDEAPHTMQTASVVRNYIDAPSGLYMYEDPNSAVQTVTVTGNTFTGTETTNAGSGVCVGQCVP